MAWFKYTFYLLLFCALPLQAYSAVIWEEDFNDIAIDLKGATGSGPNSSPVTTIDMQDVTKWSINTNANTLNNNDWFRVENKLFEGRDLDGDGIWESEEINVSDYENISFNLDAIEDGDIDGHEANNPNNTDYFDVYYSIDNAPFTLLPSWNGTYGDANHTLIGNYPDDNDWVSINLSQAIPDGSSSLKIQIKMRNSSGAERISLDNVTVEGELIDSDSDGVPNNADLDDDNDGILDTVECPGSFTDFKNGSFELPTISTPWSPVLASSVPGWETDDPSNNIEIWTSGAINSVPAADGGFLVELQYTQYSSVYQVITTEPGAVISWSGYHRGRYGTDVAHVRIGSSLALATTEQVMSDGQSWNQYSGSYTVPAGQTTTYFVLTPISNSTPSNPSAGNLVDGWTITSSKLCDTDSDGIPDLLDLDSDGDSCKDTDEAYGVVGTDTNNDGTWGGVIGISEVDANGLVTAAGVTGSSYNTTPAQTAGVKNTFQQAIIVTVDDDPADQGIQENSTATFTAEASAAVAPTTTPTTTASTDVDYQWQISTDGGTTFTDIAGASGTATSGDTVSYTTPALNEAAEGNLYRVSFNNEAKICPIKTTSAIVDINSAPVAEDDTESTQEDTTLTVAVADGLIQDNDTDLENDTLTITGFTISGVSGTHSSGDTVTIPNIGDLTINGDGSYEFIPVANYHGTVPTATYTISDGNGGTDSAELIITVNSVDDFPTAVDDTITTITEDSGANTINVLAGDSFGGDGPSSGAITLPSATSANGGTVTVNNNGTPNDPTDDKVIYTPAANFNGSDSFDYTITDSNGDTSTATVTITVVSVNDQPTAVDDTITGINEDSGANTINVLAGDDFGGDGANTGAITLPSATSTNGGTVTVDNNGTPNNPSDDKVIYTPDTNFNGSDSFDYTITDSNGDTSTATVTITVVSVNDQPTAVDDTITGINEDSGANTIDVLAGDDFGGDGPSSGAITLPSNSSANGGTLSVDNNGTPNDPTDDKVIYTPAANFNGSDSFDYTIIDSDGDTSTATVTVTVNAVNDPPVPDDEILTAVAGVTITLDVLDGDTDPNGDALTITQVDGNPITNNGAAITLSDGTTVALVDGKLVVTPATGIATTSFTYTVDDGNGGVAQAQVIITLSAPPAHEAIPTLSEWALLLLIMMLGLFGYRQGALQRERSK